MPIFSSAEIERRWREVAARLGDADCLVVPSFHNSYYLSGVPVLQWGRFAVTVLFRDREPLLVLPAFEESAARANSPIRELRLYEDSDGPSIDTASHLVAEAVGEVRARTIAVEEHGMPAAMYLLLREALPEARFVDAGDAVDEVRLVSSDEELGHIRSAAAVAVAGMQAVLGRIHPGLTEAELAAEGRLAMERAVPPWTQASFACYMQQGERSLECHADSSSAPIREGVMVEIVCECEAWHYQAAVERCVLVGDVPAEVERAYGAMLAAFRACGAAVRPGGTFAAADEAARRVLTDAGYRRITNGSGLARNIVHHTGGRIESGNLRVYNQRRFEPGMVVSVEPWALVPGVGGPRHCDTVVVTEDGNESLTNVDAGLLRARARGPAG